VTTAEAEEAIVEQFASAWNAAHSSIDFCLENESFTPDSDKPWLRVTVQPQARVQESMGPVGGRNFLSLGTVYVQVFTPLDEGTAQNRQLCDAVKDCFEGISLGGGSLRLYAAAVRAIGPDDKWYMSNVATTFDFDETR